MFAVPDNTIASSAAAHPDLRHPVRVARAVAADRSRWAHLLRYDPDERFAVLIGRDEHEEIWLMSWLPGQRTDLHDHGDASGAFTVVSGALTEAVARTGAVDALGSTVQEHEVAAGKSRVFGPGYVHQVSNAGPDPAISVHVYRYGGRTMRPYRVDPERGAVMA
jgi:predicted metal-dependent enzyme (double-stranded beta helix superfamily)